MTATVPLGASSRIYELYVPWESRLAREIPVLEKWLRGAGARQILDAACGPGRHAVALAKRGFEVTGIDAAPEMLELAREHAAAEAVDVRFVETRLESMASSLDEPFDALICLGNSLSAVDDPALLPDIVRSFAGVLRPKGLAITQIVDYSVVAPDPVNPSPVRHVDANGAEYWFVKSFVRVDAQVFIHMVAIEKSGESYRSDVRMHAMVVIEPNRLRDLFSQAGFSNVEALSDYAGRPFEPGRSKDVILLATR